MPPLSIAQRRQWWRETLGSPRFVCAPMVLQSELAFRMLVRRHGAALCYSPMLPAANFLASQADGPGAEHPVTGGPNTQASWFTTHAHDRPLIVQIGGSDPAEVLAAAQLVQERCDAIDLNFGCPQRCAFLGGYGACTLASEECTPSCHCERVHTRRHTPEPYPAASQPRPLSLVASYSASRRVPDGRPGARQGARRDARRRPARAGPMTRELAAARGEGEWLREEEWLK